jgi:hypothetical protein
MRLAIRPCGFDLPARPFGLSAISGTATVRLLLTLGLFLLQGLDSPLEASQDLLEEIGFLPGSGKVREAHGTILGELAAFAAALPATGAVILVPQVSRASDPGLEIPGRELLHPSPEALPIERELVPTAKSFQSLRLLDHGMFSCGMFPLPGNSLEQLAPGTGFPRSSASRSQNAIHP